MAEMMALVAAVERRCSPEVIAEGRELATARQVPVDDIQDDYTLVRLVGEGGFGVVLRAIDNNSNQFVALKILRPTGDSAIAEIRAEVQLGVMFSQLRNKAIAPGFVRVLDTFQADTIPDAWRDVLIADASEAAESWQTRKWRGPYWFIVMELGDGGSLEQYLAAQCTAGEMLTDAQMRFATFQMCWSMQAVWREYGIQHCDIKPANLVLKEREPSQRNIFQLGGLEWELPLRKRGGGLEIYDLKIIDFGLACGEGIAQHLGGTLGYLPPEILFRGTVERSVVSDFWAIGITLLDMVATALEGCNFNAVEWHMMDLLAQYEPEDVLFPVAKDIMRGSREKGQYPCNELADASVILAQCYLQHALGNGLMPPVDLWPAVETSPIYTALEGHQALLFTYADDPEVNVYLPIVASAEARLGPQGIDFLRRCCAWGPELRPQSFEALFALEFFEQFSVPLSDPARDEPSSMRWGSQPEPAEDAVPETAARPMARARGTRRRFSIDLGFPTSPATAAAAASDEDGDASTAEQSVSPSRAARILRGRKRNRAQVQDSETSPPLKRTHLIDAHDTPPVAGRLRQRVRATAAAGQENDGAAKAPAATDDAPRTRRRADPLRAIR